MTITNVRLLCPHLTEQNHLALLTAATHQSRAEVERQVAAIRPLPPVPSIVRKLPQPKPAVSIALPVEPLELQSFVSLVPVSAPPSKPAVVQPLAPERYRLQFTISGDTHDKLTRLEDLLRHSIPSGDVAVIFDKALTLLLADVERTKLAATARPRATRGARQGSRHIPAPVRRAVSARDDGRCAFVGTQGRCDERGFLEFHHVVPFAAGGAATVENIQLRCRPHNSHEAALYFGSSAEFVREERAVFA